MKSSHAINYRPDIDGLRAVAVLTVIAFHAFPEWVAGGFVGVDIFCDLWVFDYQAYSRWSA